MVTASSPHCVLVIGGGISSETAATASYETTTTTVNHSYTNQTPSLKTMERTPVAEYNPDRIPASVFSNKPSNQTDWSMASNESLFSIRMGPSNSTKDITLPEEVAVSQDSNNSFFSLPALPDDDQNAEMISSSSSSKSSSSQSSSTDDGDDEEEDEEEVSESGEMVKPELTKIIVEKEVRSSSVSDDDKETRRSDTARSSATQLSESSWNSKTSFAFPILAANKQGRHESKNVTIKIPPAQITAHKETQPAAPSQNDMIAAPDRTRSWFCCFSFRFPIFCRS